MEIGSGVAPARGLGKGGPVDGTFWPAGGGVVEMAGGSVDVRADNERVEPTLVVGVVGGTRTAHVHSSMLSVVLQFKPCTRKPPILA